jgi:hypothetical protein
MSDVGREMMWPACKRSSPLHRRGQPPRGDANSENNRRTNIRRVH